MSREMVWDLEVNRGRDRAAPPDSAQCTRGCRAHRLANITYGLAHDADTAPAVAAEAALARSVEAPLPADPVERERQVRAVCLVEQWRLSRGDTRTARRAIRAVSAFLASADSVAAGPEAAVCAAALDAMLATAERRPDARTAVDRFDAVVRREGQLVGYGPWAIAAPNLLVARLREAHGDVPGALAAVRRRPYHAVFGPLFLSTFLREEGRLAALVGDTAGAVRAYRHYLALRSDPQPRLAADAARARAALARLERPLAAAPGPRPRPGAGR
jgi:hypothetical protein